ncbi:unnamed protein product, partial [Dibothriocephalus latus]
HKKFPIGFLQIAIKFTNEPPEGIKANLSRTYLGITQDFLEICVTFHWRVMLYSLAFLHCTVQERRKFGPIAGIMPDLAGFDDVTDGTSPCVAAVLELSTKSLLQLWRPNTEGPRNPFMS